MTQFVSAQDAVSRVPDGCTLAVGGFNGFGAPDALLAALRERFLSSGAPRGLTLMKSVSVGDRGERGVSRIALEGLLRGRILFTPGHTGDSISLQVGNVVFCGDAAMEGYPSSHHVTIWVENVAQFGRSWDTLCEGGAETVYPAHGRPFDMGELAECRSFVDSVKLRS